MARAVGFIEAEGFVPVFDAVDAMVKATEVEVRGAVRLGGGLVAVAVTGDLATVEEAVEVGEEVARAVSGRAVKSIVFASPCLPVQALAKDIQTGRYGDGYRTIGGNDDNSTMTHILILGSFHG